MSKANPLPANMIERRHLFAPAEVRMTPPSEEDADDQKIRGYAAVFYREGDAGTQYQLWTGAVERIMPGAFDRAIKEDDVRGLFNHMSSQVLGRSKSGTMRIGVDDVGLWYEIDPADTTISRDVVEHLNREDVTGSSMSMRVGREGQTWKTEETPDGIEIEVREIHDVGRLYDVGPVTFPAYEGTEAEMRSADDPARQAHDAWAQNNETRSVAKRRHQLRRLQAGA